MLQQKAAEHIRVDSRDEHVVVDTHASVKTLKGYLPGLPENVLRALNPDAFIIIEGDPEEVYNRRNKDSSRKRDEETIARMSDHQMMNRCFTAVYADLTDRSDTHCKK